VQVEEPATSAAIGSAVVLSEEQLISKVGTYFNDQRAASRQITYAEGVLQFQGYALVPLNENLFFFEVEPQTKVAFLPGEGDSVVEVKTITSSAAYRYARVETTAPTREELEAYTGRYYSPELDINWDFFAEEDHLIAKRRKYPNSQLTALFHDTFKDDWAPLMGYPTTYLVRFERDGQDKIVGLTVSGDRVRHISFSKQME
jgi:hypothetical protein